MKRMFAAIVAFVLSAMAMSTPVLALSEAQLDMFAQNNILFYNPGNLVCLDEADEYYDSERNASIVIGELMEEGYSHDSVLAIAGNLARESGFDPRKLEKGYKENESIVVEEGWKAWKDGGRTFYGGFGLVQWTTDGRVQRLQEYADENNMWVGSLKAQIGFMIKELSDDYDAAPDKLNAMTIEESTWQIFRYYETPGASFWIDHGDPPVHYNDRVPYTLSDLSETETAAAWTEYHARLDTAKDLAGLEPTKLSGGCNSGGEGGGDGYNLAEIAVSMAWPDENGKCEDKNGKMIKWSIKNREECGVKPRYREVVQSVYGNRGFNYRDCGKFVKAAVMYSGIDPNFSTGNTKGIMDYLNGSGSSIWTKIDNLENTSNLQPGDIFIVRYGNGGHVFIYTGDISEYGDRADASLNKRTGNMGKVYYKEKRDNGTFYYQIFRYTGGGNAEL